MNEDRVDDDREMMTRKLYAVIRQEGHWGIRVSNAPFLSCDSYQEALDVATNAAAILRSAHDGPSTVRAPTLSGGTATLGGQEREPT
jgi:hypothetical protein